MAEGIAEAPVTVTDRLTHPFRRLMQQQSASGIILIACAALAFAWANSPWADSYFHMKHIETAVEFGSFHLHLHLEHVVNDLLMAIFFFVVGLEIKREFMVGELAGIRRAALPIAGAIGGMVVPALIYVAFNLGEPTLRGWGVPMATDIAFAVGVLAIIGDRVPLALKVFLLALAIVDDLGAVIVIAVFYTADLDVNALLISLVVWGVALLYGRFGHARAMVFVLIGAVCWYFMHESGVHATIAGVLMALSVPLGGTMREDRLTDEVRQMVMPAAGGVEVKVERMGYLVDRARSPLLSFEHTLSPWVAFFIMPVFAVFNAGVAVGGSSEGSIIGLATIGAFFGLLLGKPVGIAATAWLTVRVGLASFPRDANWPGVVGIGCLGGIGFTMALFVANLAFGPTLALDQAKIGVLSASVVSAVVGYILLLRAFPKVERETATATA
ncbi:MAG: Na+/H+ antiporter NhaA [Pseudomonadota bacterium]